jgi:hypothetical protein
MGIHTTFLFGREWTIVVTWRSGKERGRTKRMSMEEGWRRRNKGKRER